MNNFTINEPKKYTIDYDKVNDLEDVKCILKSLVIIFNDNYEHFNELKPYLKEIK